MLLTKHLLAHSLIPLILGKEKFIGNTFPFYLLGNQESMNLLLDRFQKTFKTEEFKIQEFKIGVPLKIIVYTFPKPDLVCESLYGLIFMNVLDKSDTRYYTLEKSNIHDTYEQYIIGRPGCESRMNYGPFELEINSFKPFLKYMITTYETNYMEAIKDL